MAKIRTIKPEFWEDEKLGRLKRDCRLLFAGIFNFADDAGVIKSNPVYIKSRVFPYDEDLRVSEVKQWLDTLVNARMLIPLEYNQESYYIIRTFNTHQVIDKRYARYSIPLQIIESAIIQHSDGHTVNTTGTHSELVGRSAQEMEGKGNGNGGGGGNSNNPTPTGSVMKSIDDLLTDCLADKINFVEHVMRQNKIGELQLTNAMGAFNLYLKSGGELVKQDKDYRFHFQNWLKKQDLKQFRINPQPRGSNGAVLKNIGLT
jgi:hypothetical protein